MSWLNSSGAWINSEAPAVPSLLDSSEVWAAWRSATYEHLQREWGDSWATAFEAMSCTSVRPRSENEARSIHDQARLRHAAVERAAATDRVALHQDAAIRAAQATEEVVQAEQSALERARAARVAQHAEAERLAAERLAAEQAAKGERVAVHASEEQAAAEKATAARVGGEAGGGRETPSVDGG